ncbi:AprI/Inh family metalloprotease inhibitor [Pseudoxanthomonas sp. SGT-18]|uniref:AprI/Inh family metalloprotease inhibitor n=1 Tax=Pseudoxanthomonas sp. SGT-18 TaxID=2493087 RepID=UPI000F629B4A|nr:AprI/Inh family metalloprotease inhibitor [Pseudoxanthomonas sp. SGT-18]
MPGGCHASGLPRAIAGPARPAGRVRLCRPAGRCRSRRPAGSIPATTCSTLPRARCGDGRAHLPVDLPAGGATPAGRLQPAGIPGAGHGSRARKGHGRRRHRGRALAGAWDLWEDTEGGSVCPVTLQATPNLGGHALEADPACLASLGLEGEAFAWLIDGRDQSLVLVDATRKAIVRLPRSGEREFYLPRDGNRRYGLMLNPAQ